MKKVKLSDISTITTGNTPSKKNEDYYNAKDIYFIKPDEIRSFDSINYLEKSKYYLSERAREKARIVNENSVLVTCIGNIGKVGFITTEEVAFNQQINALKADEEKVTSKYLAYTMLYNQSRLQFIANAPVVPQVNKTQLSNFEVYIHDSLKEQQKIVEILDSVQIIITKREKQLQELNLLQENLLLKIMENNDLNSFKMSDLLQKLVTGKSYAGNVNSEYRVLKTSCVYSGYFDDTEWKYLPKDYIPKEEHIVKKGDIIVSRMNTSELVGVSGYVRKDYEDLAVPDRLWILKTKDNVNNIFLWKLMQTKYYRMQIDRISTGTSGSMKNISQKNFKSIVMPLPNIEVQNDFAQKIEEIEQIKEKMESSLNEMNTLFDALMQKAFTKDLS